MRSERSEREAQLLEQLRREGPAEAEILSSGCEITSGEVLDTNSSFLARSLRSLDIDCVRIASLPDDRELIMDYARAALRRSGLLLVTGGLGPTEDDLSMEALASAFSLSLYEEADCLEHIDNYFRSRGHSCPPNNRKQALMPEGALYLPNSVGTACGAFFSLSFEGRTRYVALLPGPPREMREMYRNSLEPLLAQCGGRRLRTHSFRCFGLGESELEMRIRDLLHRDPAIRLATYVGRGEIHLKLCWRAPLGADEGAFEELISELRQRLGEWIFEEGERHLPEVLVALLCEKKLRIGGAESCTAGLCASLIASVPGASEVFPGALVSYQEAIKTRWLGLAPELLSGEGAVSEACARAMAAGAREQTSADLAYAITGFAGPGGGTKEKPVGTVYIAVAGPKGCICRRYFFGGSRQNIRERSAAAALELCCRSLQGRLKKGEELI